MRPWDCRKWLTGGNTGLWSSWGVGKVGGVSIGWSWNPEQNFISMPKRGSNVAEVMHHGPSVAVDTTCFRPQMSLAKYLDELPVQDSNLNITTHFWLYYLRRLLCWIRTLCFHPSAPSCILRVSSHWLPTFSFHALQSATGPQELHNRHFAWRYSR